MPKHDPIEVPDAVLNQSYRCADCAKETGGDGLQPGSEFNWARAPKYKLGFRKQSYCKRHQSLRNGAAQKKRLQQPEAKEARRAWDREHWKRYQARRYADSRAWYARHREERAEAYRAWVERNPGKRKASQDAWRARQRLRGRAVAVHRPIMKEEQRDA